MVSIIISRELQYTIITFMVVSLAGTSGLLSGQNFRTEFQDKISGQNFRTEFSFKGQKAYVQVTVRAKMAMPNSFIETNLIKNVKNNDVFLTRKLLSSDNFFIASYKQEMHKTLSQRNRKRKFTVKIN